MGDRRFVVAIPWWLYVIGVIVVSVLWTGVIFAIGILLLCVAIIYLLIGLFSWIARAIRERNNP